jgi:folate-binding protein YgfZ
MTGSCPLIGHVQCIVIEGAEARRFAQAQLSGDVDTLAPGHWQWNAWLTPQGRVRALMHLADAGDGRLCAVLRGGDAEGVRAALARYLLRLRATLAVREFACRAGGPATFGTAAIEDGDIVLGYGSRSLRLGIATAEGPDADAETAWRLEDIRQGWPILPAGEPEFLPPALGLEHLEAVSFDKGCYPGQEIAARLRYRGGHKYRLYHLRGAVPLAGDPAASQQDTAWRVLDGVNRDGTRDVLAVGPLDMPHEIGVLDRPFQVISRFEP